VALFGGKQPEAHAKGAIGGTVTITPGAPRLAAARQFHVASRQLLSNTETICLLAEIVQVERVDFTLKIDDRLDLLQLLVTHRFLDNVEQFFRFVPF
jgi:hypothetical protein